MGRLSAICLIIVIFSRVRTHSASNKGFSHQRRQKQNSNDFDEIVRQKSFGNNMAQCPCVLHPQSRQCISYDSRYLATSIEEAILAFIDLTNIDYYENSLITRRTFDCSTASCLQCFSILFHRLVEIGLISKDYKTKIRILPVGSLNLEQCPRFRFFNQKFIPSPPVNVPPYVRQMVQAGQAFASSASSSALSQNRNNQQSSSNGNVGTVPSVSGIPAQRVFPHRPGRPGRPERPGNGGNNHPHLPNNQAFDTVAAGSGIGAGVGIGGSAGSIPSGVVPPAPIPTLPPQAHPQPWNPQPQPWNPNPHPQPQPQPQPQPWNPNPLPQPQPWNPNPQPQPQPWNPNPQPQPQPQPQPWNPNPQPEPQPQPWNPSPQYPDHQGWNGQWNNQQQSTVSSSVGSSLGAGLFSPIHNLLGSLFGGGGGLGNEHKIIIGRKRKKRETEELVGKRFTIGCINRGETETDGDLLSLCGNCWTWRQLPPDYFPRIVNELSCKEDDYCLSGWGQCKQQYRNIDVLKNVGGRWIPTAITTSSCCDCKIAPGTEIHALVTSDKSSKS